MMTVYSFLGELSPYQISKMEADLLGAKYSDKLKVG